MGGAASELLAVDWTGEKYADEDSAQDDQMLALRDELVRTHRTPHSTPPRSLMSASPRPLVPPSSSPRPLLVSSRILVSVQFDATYLSANTSPIAPGQAAKRKIATEEFGNLFAPPAPAPVSAAAAAAAAAADVKDGKEAKDEKGPAAPSAAATANVIGGMSADDVAAHERVVRALREETASLSIDQNTDLNAYTKTMHQRFYLLQRVRRRRRRRAPYVTPHHHTTWHTTPDTHLTCTPPPSSLLAPPSFPPADWPCNDARH
jgi:hypothetical protein